MGVAAPNFRTPRLLGIFSVVFASALLLGGICMGGYVAIMPMFGKMIDSTQAQIEAQARAAKTAELDALAVQEKAAKTAEERAALAADRARIEARPRTAMFSAMDINKAQFGDPAFIRFSWADVLSGIVLNLLLLTSGVGLLHWRPWARTLGVWTASLKLVRLVVVYGYFIVAIVPPYSERIGKAVYQMMGGVRPTPFGDASYFVKLYTVMYTGMGLGVMVVGAVYPAIVLWLLTRPGVKSACSGTLRLPKEPNQPC